MQIMQLGEIGDDSDFDQKKIKDYIEELSQYVNEHNFFDPFESMSKGGQLGYNDILEALKNGFPIFASLEDMQMLASNLITLIILILI